MNYGDLSEMDNEGRAVALHNIARNGCTPVQRDWNWTMDSTVTFNLEHEPQRIRSGGLSFPVLPRHNNPAYWTMC